MSVVSRRQAVVAALVLAIASGGYLLLQVRAARPVGDDNAPLRERVVEEANPPGQVIRVVLSDGSPAAGVEAYGVQVDQKTPLEELTLRPAEAETAAVSGLDGLVGIQRSAILAARVTSDAVALLPIHGETIALPEVATIELQLDPSEVAGELGAGVVVRSAELLPWMVEGLQAPAADFAKLYEVRGWALAEPKIFAWRFLRLASSAPVQLQLPRGDYVIEDAGAGHGSWIRPLAFTVASNREVLVSIYRPPTAERSCIDQGERRRPADVFLRCDRYSVDCAVLGFGWPLRWRLDGDSIHVAIEDSEHAMALEADSNPMNVYWLEVTWEGGDRSATDYLGREDLEGPLELADLSLRRH